MKGKSFFGLIKPQIVYPSTATAASDFKRMPAPNRATFLIRDDWDKTDKAPLKVGDTVKTGQKLIVSVDPSAYAVSSITGTVSDISPFSGDSGQNFTAVTIDASGEETPDNSWEAAAEQATLETAAEYLDALPGAPGLARFLKSEHGIHTLVVLCADKDMLVGTQQHVLTSQSEALKSGIRILKEITGIDQLFLAVPKDRVQGYGSLGAEVKAIDQKYPSARPRLVMKDVLGTVVPMGKTTEEMGVAFFSAEAVAAIGTAYETKKLPTKKTLTIIRKDGRRSLLETDLGTPIQKILATLGETLNEKDRLILGGPMTGSAIYSDLHPVCPDTDAIMVQDHSDISFVSDADCINCGECVRACPVNIPVNMLVRFLAAGSYEDAANLYDLYTCIECGLCTYVCISKIPIAQYIRLGKHELDRAKAAEETND
jgi:Na+-translocating ferredoxin:NAD+ oxidoreductase subunit C